jgi:hypothetical protein
MPRDASSTANSRVTWGGALSTANGFFSAIEMASAVAAAASLNAPVPVKNSNSTLRP